ncbi:MAG: UDP-glucose--hexose-1-phosphate uridylyltransferase [Lachnospiraceae bacterium]|nr:UDP-glucose--hexose-1-phosphate uridylyltransferase [Lachnospiraceae bacterium]
MKTEDIGNSIKDLVEYGLHTGLIEEDERIYSTNLILDVMDLDSYEEPEGYEKPDFSDPGDSLEAILKALINDAVKRGVAGDDQVSKDLFDTKLMNCITPRPSQVRERFRKLYEKSPSEATDWYYGFSCDTDYIRRYRIKKDLKWRSETPYGELDITINLSKPEKDPKAIAAAKNAPQSSYPKCQLCAENEGYRGRVNHPARENHRVIPITLAGEDFFLQYSPYVYYNEHCIVFNKSHIPMKIDRACFEKLFDFITLFPHYTVGSNADLPIVGGSILSHDHFQGGNYEFPMARADYISKFSVKGFENVEAGIIKWPLSVIRLRSRDKDSLIDLASHILDKWRDYTDESAFIFANTDGEPHNTITPIARKRGELYEFDLALRNNITTEECPLGVYHPHSELHHIKKENIGLIEVMGLAILPSRLKEEMALLKEYILAGKDVASNELIAKHSDWVLAFMPNYVNINSGNIDSILQNEIGTVFSHVLEDAGVFKQTESGIADFERFVSSL